MNYRIHLPLYNIGIKGLNCLFCHNHLLNFFFWHIHFPIVLFMLYFPILSGWLPLVQDIFNHIRLVIIPHHRWLLYVLLFITLLPRITSSPFSYTTNINSSSIKKSDRIIKFFKFKCPLWNHPWFPFWSPLIICSVEFYYP